MGDGNSSAHLGASYETYINYRLDIKRNAFADVSLHKSAHPSNQADPRHKPTIHKHANGDDIQEGSKCSGTPAELIMGFADSYKPEEKQ